MLSVILTLVVCAKFFNDFTVFCSVRLSMNVKVPSLHLSWEKRSKLRRDLEVVKQKQAAMQSQKMQERKDYWDRVRAHQQSKKEKQQNAQVVQVVSPVRFYRIKYCTARIYTLFLEA